MAGDTGSSYNMRLEYKAWLDVVADFRHIVGEINDPKYDALIRSVILWGEQLVGLRVVQTEEMRQAALSGAERRWAETHPRAENAE